MSKKNTAKKLTPSVGMILARREKNNSKTGPAKVLTVDHDKGKISVYRPGGRTPHTIITFDSLSRYRPTTPDEFPGVNFDETADAARSTLTDAPASQRKANDEEPKSEPPPPAAANDVALVQVIERMEMRIDSKFSAFVREQQAATNAFMERVLERFAAPSAPAPVKTKEEEREEATNKQVNEEMPWAEPQMWKFIGEAMEFVTFETQAEIDRALKPLEFYEQFALWCRINNLRVPFQKTVFRAMLSDKRTQRRHKISSKEEKTALAIRRQARFGFDELQPIGKDVQAIMVHARKVWPTLADSHAETIANLLMPGKITKADIIRALDHIATDPKRYPPEIALMESSIKALVRNARAAGGAK